MEGYKGDSCRDGEVIVILVTGSYTSGDNDVMTKII